MRVNACQDDQMIWEQPERGLAHSKACCSKHFDKLMIVASGSWRCLMTRKEVAYGDSFDCRENACSGPMILSICCAGGCQRFPVGDYMNSV
jgi:hypothetical protein